MRRIEFNDEYRYNPNDARDKPRWYILHGRTDMLKSGARAGAFRLVSAPDQKYPLRIVYVPVCPSFDEFDFIEGGVEYIIADSGIQLRDSEESDARTLVEERNDWLRVIHESFTRRDAGQAEQLTPSMSLLDDDWAELAQYPA
jgi:hypothetical protein